MVVVGIVAVVVSTLVEELVTRLVVTSTIEEVERDEVTVVLSMLLVDVGTLVELS